ncbi:MAG: prepilin-type N-terminal cleavage/methylation domain-containing protein [Coraliomargarita sp.]|nr:prepilin-type N-terminal cleavage/methylation domain-containing protein [Coraliomargarita sp.]
MRYQKNSAFTLVEIMVVVVIIGLLAALALPTIKNAKQNSQFTRLLNDFRVFSDAVEQFAFTTGDFPEDSNTGAIPTGMEDYIQIGVWNEGPSIGGSWDVEKSGPGYLSAIGVHRYEVDDDVLLAFDTRYDDGDLTAGVYQQIDSDRYYRIIAGD